MQAFADGLDHPRWLYVLPNGDVLVAETNAPPKPEDASGFKGWIMGVVMKKAGAATPSANRITLLRDTDGDGVANVRTVLLQGLHSPFGMAWEPDSGALTGGPTATTASTWIPVWNPSVPIWWRGPWPRITRWGRIPPPWACGLCAWHLVAGTFLGALGYGVGAAVTWGV